MNAWSQSIPACKVVLHLLIGFIIYFPMLTLKQIGVDGEIHKTNAISSWNTMPYRGCLTRKAVCL